MVRGTNDIVSWFGNTKMPYWRIYPHKNIGGGNIVLQSEQEEGQSPGDALKDLQYKIRVIARGFYTIAAFPEPNKLPPKGYHLTEIEIPQSEPQHAQIAGPVGISPEDVQRQIDAALMSYKQAQELEQMKKEFTELKKENKELKQAVDAPWNKVIGTLAPYAPQIIQGIFPQAAVAGFPQPDNGPVDNHIQEAEVVEGAELTQEQSAVISEFINELSAADPDWLNTLKRLTKKIKESPSMIGMVKTFI